MGKGSLKEKNHRRDCILGLLRSGDVWTVSSLSDELSVSHRTILRDLNDLRATGIPIETERGRGGGVRLIGRWGVERLNLSNSEVISLLVSLAMSETLSSSLVVTHSKSLRQKIALTFPESQRRQIDKLRSRILFGEPASDSVLRSYRKPNASLMERLTTSFFEATTIEVGYQSGNGMSTKRVVEPHYLLLNWPVWYVLGWDSLRTDVRMFRTDRIRSLLELHEPNKRRPKSIFLDSYKEYFTSL
jgi:predicted DNA-binding transcriptional regulator YafY